ncbi:MAG: GGDEF domain-containing protein, partial [Nitrospirae bacterium]|nr:GGDEF domain-containing protein [Nitrospirota bacterium]
RLVELATYDDLTKILNRKGIIASLESEFRRVFRHKYPLSLLLIDLDHFKKINDSHGHIQGDFVLRASSSRMKEALRQEDYLGRYGGDEFLAVLPHTDFKGAMIVAQRLVEEFSQAPLQRGKLSFNQTVSIGVASYESGDTLTSFLERTDGALYQSKTDGRCRCFGRFSD